MKKIRNEFQTGKLNIRNVFNSILIFLVFSILISILYLRLADREELSRHKELAVQAENILQLIETDLQKRTWSLHRIVNRWEIRGGTPESEFVKDVLAYIEDEPGYSAVGWLDNELNIRWVVPSETEWVTQEANPERNSRLLNDLESARERKVPIVTPPAELPQRGAEFFIYEPIFVGRSFDGFISAAFNTHEWLEYLFYPPDGHYHIDNIEFSVFMDGLGIFEGHGWSEENNEPLWEETAERKISGHSFSVRIHPGKEFFQRNHSMLPEIILVTGLLLSLLTAITVFLAGKANMTASRMAEGNAVLADEIETRKRTEKQLEKSRDLFGSILSNIPGMVYRSGTEYERSMLFLSEFAERITGYPAADFIGSEVHSYDSIITDDDRVYVRRSIEDAVKSGMPWELEYRILRSDGILRWVYEKGRHIAGEDEKEEYLDGVIFDITFRKDMEAEKEDLLHTIGERIKELDCLYSLSAFADKADSTVESILQSTAELIPKSWQYSEYSCARIKFDDHDFKSRGFRESEWMQQTSILIDKVERGLIQVFYNRELPDAGAGEGPFLKEERNLIHEIAARLGNIIEKKQASESLAAERRRLSFILRGTNAGTWEWNIQTGETIFNEQWANIIGYRLEEISPVSIETWTEFAHPDDLKLSDELLEKHFAGELDYYECEARMRHKNGGWVWVLDRGKVSERTADGKPLWMFGTHQDITERKESEEQIKRLATHDPLTELPNLRVVRDRADMALKLARRRRSIAAVMFIDLDGFKRVNDNHGHDAGDQVLREISGRLIASVRETDTVARIGGDEFIIVLTELQGRADAAGIAEKIIVNAGRPIIFKGTELSVGVSIGIALYPADGSGVENMIKRADEAMYVIKKSGKNGYAFAESTG